MSSNKTSQITMETDFVDFRDFLTATTHKKFVEKIISLLVDVPIRYQCLKRFLKVFRLHLRICNITSLGKFMYCKETKHNILQIIKKENVKSIIVFLGRNGKIYSKLCETK